MTDGLLSMPAYGARGQESRCYAYDLRKADMHNAWEVVNDVRSRPSQGA